MICIFQFRNGERITEISASNDIDFSRYSSKSNRGLSFKTTVAFGPHASIPHFETFNETDIEITDKEPCIFDSGGQYNEGTTIVSRTSIQIYSFCLNFVFSSNFAIFFCFQCILASQLSIKNKCTQMFYAPLFGYQR